MHGASSNDQSGEIALSDVSWRKPDSSEVEGNVKASLECFVTIPRGDVDDTHFEKLTTWLADLINAIDDKKDAFSINRLCSDEFLWPALFVGVGHKDSRVVAASMRAIGIVATFKGKTGMDGILLLCGIALSESGAKRSSIKFDASNLLRVVEYATAPHRQSILRVYIAGLSALDRIASCPLAEILLFSPDNAPSMFVERIERTMTLSEVDKTHVRETLTSACSLLTPLECESLFSSALLHANAFVRNAGFSLVGTITSNCDEARAIALLRIIVQRCSCQGNTHKENSALSHTKSAQWITGAAESCLFPDDAALPGPGWPSLLSEILCSSQSQRLEFTANTGMDFSHSHETNALGDDGTVRIGGKRKRSVLPQHEKQDAHIYEPNGASSHPETAIMDTFDSLVSDVEYLHNLASTTGENKDVAQMSDQSEALSMKTNGSYGSNNENAPVSHVGAIADNDMTFLLEADLYRSQSALQSVERRQIVGVLVRELCCVDFGLPLLIKRLRLVAATDLLQILLDDVHFRLLGRLDDGMCTARDAVRGLVAGHLQVLPEEGAECVRVLAIINEHLTKVEKERASVYSDELAFIVGAVYAGVCTSSVAREKVNVEIVLEIRRTLQFAAHLLAELSSTNIDEHVSKPPFLNKTLIVMMNGLTVSSAWNWLLLEPAQPGVTDTCVSLITSICDVFSLLFQSHTEGLCSSPSSLTAEGASLLIRLCPAAGQLIPWFAEALALKAGINDDMQMDLAKLASRTFLLLISTVKSCLGTAYLGSEDSAHGAHFLRRERVVLAALEALTKGVHSAAMWHETKFMVECLEQSELLAFSILSYQFKRTAGGRSMLCVYSESVLGSVLQFICSPQLRHRRGCVRSALLSEPGYVAILNVLQRASDGYLRAHVLLLLSLLLISECGSPSDGSACALVNSVLNRYGSREGVENVRSLSIAEGATLYLFLNFALSDEHASVRVAAWQAIFDLFQSLSSQNSVRVLAGLAQLSVPQSSMWTQFAGEKVSCDSSFHVTLGIIGLAFARVCLTELDPEVRDHASRVANLYCSGELCGYPASVDCRDGLVCSMVAVRARALVEAEQARGVDRNCLNLGRTSIACGGPKLSKGSVEPDQDCY